MYDTSGFHRKVVLFEINAVKTPLGHKSSPEHKLRFFKITEKTTYKYFSDIQKSQIKIEMKSVQVQLEMQMVRYLLYIM